MLIYPPLTFTEPGVQDISNITQKSDDGSSAATRRACRAIILAVVDPVG
jgi:hypothetical protein